MIDTYHAVQKYLKEDRQWKREHRIAHAKAELARSQNKTAREFWLEILDANKDD
jgi:hypothetical protein